jgi:DNA-binding transcriptional LysR family regulator
MRFEQLEALEAITRLGSMRRASEELSISPPALSEAVRNLERELGVELFDRLRSGARITATGQELLSYVADVLESVHRLRGAADEQHRISRVIRIGTVGAATVTVALPAIRAFRTAHPEAHIEMVTARRDEIDEGLVGGRLELGLVNLLDGDDVDPAFEALELLRGRVVVCCRSDSALAQLAAVGVERLRTEQLIVMRPGYVMHRYVHRLLGGKASGVSYATDGAEMGKLMVAEGLGATVLPDFSVVGDPMEVDGTITCRPIDGRDDEVTLVLQRRRARHVPDAVRHLEAALVERAGAVGHRPLSGSVTSTCDGQPRRRSAGPSEPAA